MIRLGNIIAAVALAVACGGAPAQPPTSGARSGSPEGVCGGFEKLAPGKPVSLLADRLRITPLEGAEDSARPEDVMSAPAADTTETRLFLKKGELKFVIFSEELFAKTTANLLTRIKNADTRLENARFDEVTLASGLRTVFAVHPRLAAPNEAVPVAHAFTSLEDGTVQATHVFVNPEVVAAGSGGCQALALERLRSLAPGTRKLDLTAGTRRLGDEFEIDVPSGFSVSMQAGPDFDVHHVREVREFATGSSSLGVYVGHHPSFSPEPKASKRPSTILGKNVDWHEIESDGFIQGEALVELQGGLALHLFFAAPGRAEADAIERLAATLRRIR